MIRGHVLLFCVHLISCWALKWGFNMQKMLIEGGHQLSGNVRISGAKNSAVALLPAAILADSNVMIEDLPNISDVKILGDLIEEIGGKVYWDENNVKIDPS